MANERGIGAWIARQLERREWTAAELSRRLGVSSGRVSEWTTGKSRPTSASCLRLADVFDADPDEVLALAGHRVALAPIDPDEARGRVVALLRRVDLDRHGRAEQLETLLRGWIRYDRDQDQPS